MERASACSALMLLLLSLLLLPGDTLSARAGKQLKQGPNGLSKSLKNGGLFPPVFNVATRADIQVNATCGEDGPEQFCKPSDSLRCAVCDSRSPDPNKRHRINLALDSNPGHWWQSPTLARGDHNEYVTIILDLKQHYQIEYVIVKAANSPRPTAWILEKSNDGYNYQAWQYYAPNDEECWSRYSLPPALGKPTYKQDNDVICTSFYSRQTPMENGEIHTQLLNGRPGALNHSDAIEEFTRARYVRLRLQSLRRRGETIVDKRRAFYSIREINIGGRCLCSGHASRCKSNEQRKRQECECERHTCGDTCEKCCPMYNQVPWKAGTSGRGFHCEKCNCHGHASSCRYDAEVAEKRLSLDSRGKYKGGGVCLNCTEHTTGINCEKCELGYYRPSGISADDPEPCVPCGCYERGSSGFCTADDSLKHLGKIAGQCECKPGFAGPKCDRCASGYRQFPDCVACPCDSRGILPTHDCEGDCLCKAHVHGEYCDRCKPGYFALARQIDEGCLTCVCSAVSSDCTAAKVTYFTQKSSFGWQVTDMNGSRAMVPSLQDEDGWPKFASYEVEYRHPYWLAPKLYSGNRLSCYGSNLTFLVRWIVMRGDSSGSATTEPDVILIGKNGMRIAYGEESYDGQEAEINVTLHEAGWYHVHLSPEIVDGVGRFHSSEYRAGPVTRANMLAVLSDVEHLLIRAQYHTEQIEASLKSVQLPIGEVSMDSGKPSFIEMCTCPAGYTGLSCESCDWGYAKVQINSTDHQSKHQCVKCDCNGHAATCNLVMDECSVCEHNTVGAKCDRCALGYYGDATRGTPDDCKKCACPLDVASNNFSPSCQVDNPNDVDSGYVCTQCPAGYTGDHCETCDFGYFGNPLTIGRGCEPCPCYGAPCDQETGRCLECRGNTEGWKCDKCKEAYYGNPSELNCLPCACDPLGSSSHLCDPKTGQCTCTGLFDGRDCSVCIEGYGNVTAGCVECDCGIGAIDGQCDRRTGLCACNPGTSGPKCDRCEVDHFGLSFDGCTACACDNLGSFSPSCDIVTGQCSCKPNVIGRQCDRCLADHWGLVMGMGCQACGCDPVGAYNESCHEVTGQCHCKPGVGGSRCDVCLPGHYGFSHVGCQACEPCNRPGHICNPLNGRCTCPALSLGEQCDRCRPGSFGLRPGIGCQACACSTAGSIKLHCSQIDGQCPCREGFASRQCKQCAPGYYDYPRCKPCNCDPDGSLGQCDASGQCPCKENVKGRKCNECVKGTFGLSQNNSRGCTECFCFGRSNTCRQAELSWGQKRLPRPRVLYVNDTVNEVVISNYDSSIVLPHYNSGLNKSNSLYVVPGTDGDVTLPMNFYREYPVYWQLPSTFLGDKVASYGGYLRFTTITDGGYVLREGYKFPQVQLHGNGIVLEHYLSNTYNDSCYLVKFDESVWQLKSRPETKVTRQVLMVALQNVQHIFVKASDFTDFPRATLMEASIDIASLSGIRSAPVASSVEHCECPSEYNGTSCQDPSSGYYRWREFNITSIRGNDYNELIGRAKKCRCNNRSDVCDIETGHCLNCRDNTAGRNCEICAESYFGDPNYGGCHACPCPQRDKKFSNTCILRADNQVVCVCKPGYAGNRCERCAYGHFGYPSRPGGSCEPCRCNAAGSASDECDTETGQCNCRPGSTGRDCSQCEEERKVYVGLQCMSCNDNCTGLLLDELEDMRYEFANATTHVKAGYITPPWEALANIDDNATLVLQQIQQNKHFQYQLEQLPWQHYRSFAVRSEQLLKTAMNSLNNARIINSQCGDFQNNVYSLQIEFEHLKRELNNTITELSYYGSDNNKLEISKSLKRAHKILNDIKLLDIPKRTKIFENITSECTVHIEMLHEILLSMEPVTMYKSEAHDYYSKLKDFQRILEIIMEDMFTYDSYYNEVNQTYGVFQIQKVEVEKVSSDLNQSLDEGQDYVEQGLKCIIDAENNLQIIPELQEKLEEATKNLSIIEKIQYRLNYEYKNDFVIEATAHAQKLSDYVEQYIGLFLATRAQAANPLKASQAYRNIVNDLIAARNDAQDANIILDGVKAQIYPDGINYTNLLDNALEIGRRSSEQLERTKNHTLPVIQARSNLNNQKQSVADLKHSLNTMGNSDNNINVKLRELQSNSQKLTETVNLLLLENEKTDDLISATKRLVKDYQQGIVDDLNPRLAELKRQGDSSISLASEKVAEAQSTIKMLDAKVTSLTSASDKRQGKFDKWNSTLATKLQILKDKIAEARNTADGIRVSIRSAEGKKCVRSYRAADLQPSSTTTIVMTLAIPESQREGLLFYLASSINDDYVAIEMYDRKIRFVWNVGGGTGVVTHPQILNAGSLTDETMWYRIEAERIRHLGKLSVSKQLSRSNNYLPVVNMTSSEFGLLDVTSLDRIWIGGLPELQFKPASLIAPVGLPACVHQVILDGKPIGLWNFLSNAPDNACRPCTEGVEYMSSDVSYSFNGKGYAVRSRVNSGPYNKYTFGVSISFRSYDEDALLFLAIDLDNPESHIVIFLSEGHVVLQIAYGGGVVMKMTSSLKYNSGNWTKVDAFRQYQPRTGMEKCSFSVNGESDKKIGEPTPRQEDIPDLSNAKFFIGGVPPSFRVDNFTLPTRVSFLGCISNILVQEGYDPMAEQYYGVEPGCKINKPVTIVGFYGNGFVELAGRDLRKKTSSLGFSFRTLQDYAVLLLSTFEGPEERLFGIPKQDTTLIKDNYYSVAVIDGHLEVRVNNGKGEAVLQSNGTFNDGKYHTVIVNKKRKEIELRIDDAYQMSEKLSIPDAVRAPKLGGLFFGGLPQLIMSTKKISTKTSLQGAIKDFIYNDDSILNFGDAVSFEHAFIGRPGPTMGKDSSMYSQSASLARGLSTQPEGCRKVPYYSLEPGALKFGDKANSHTQLYLNFEDFWLQKKKIEFDFRTYYPDGLLFITPGVRLKNYLAVVIRDGQLSLVIKSKQKKEILFKTPFNDGNWHHVTIGHGGRKLTMIVDAQTPMTIKVPKKIGLTNVMYIGGIPESGTPLPDSVVAKLQTLKGCIRGLKVNGNVYDMVGSTSRPYNVGQCFPNVESGAYFHEEAYAVYKKNFKLDVILELQLEIRTSELSGVLLFISGSEGSPSLSLELHEGKVVMSSDTGDNQVLQVEQNFLNPYTICDNRWHKIQAVYNDGELTLRVDELDEKYGLPIKTDSPFVATSITGSLYIGGLPVSAPKASTPLTRDHFNGCMRNIMIGGERRDWTDMSELHNIHLNTCPVQ
ncbi:laminin subunit alpha-1 [Trichogramma pretiosum]|uniref:laminin subunit alpha-1 n=1 Tax=Trichogramma pretiosum TaxID=7493 RepID=UPI000C7189ED|nr:laminin subunit alpha-1 [Trichogramma pretiosum]